MAGKPSSTKRLLLTFKNRNQLTSEVETQSVQKNVEYEDVALSTSNNFGLKYYDSSTTQSSASTKECSQQDDHPRAIYGNSKSKKFQLDQDLQQKLANCLDLGCSDTDTPMG